MQILALGGSVGSWCWVGNREMAEWDIVALSGNLWRVPRSGCMQSTVYILTSPRIAEM